MESVAFALRRMQKVEASEEQGDMADSPPSIHSSVSDVESNPEVEPEQDEVFDDESQQLLQRLVQQHLWAVMESDLSQFSTYPRQNDMTPESLSFMSTIIAYALEQDHNIVLSALLKAAIKVKDNILVNILEWSASFFKE